MAAASEGIKSAPSKILNYFKKMEKGKLIRLIVLAVLVIAIITAVTVFLNQKTYTVLYSGMDPADTGEVLSMLSEMGVDAKSQGQDTILVSDDQVDKIRLELAAKGYPSSGMNYDIYSSASGLGSTDAEKKVYYQYQLQANLRNTIMQMEKVEDATVYVVLSEDSSFVLSDNRKPASASVMLTLSDGATLSKTEVNAIAALVSKSVAGLDPKNISIVSSDMELYSASSEDDFQTADSHIALQNSVKTQLQEQIVSLLGPVFGEDNVLAEVSVILNFDTKKTESVEYSTPPGTTEGIVVSMQELVEAITNDADGNVAGIDANGNASQYLQSLDENGNAVYYNISREVNYEVNQATTQIEEAQGQIEKLSVSVILNSSNVDDYADEVKGLVATAIGADVGNITVQMLPFEAAQAQAEQDAAEASAAALVEQQMANSAQGAQTLRLVLVLIAGLVAVILLFALIKTFRPQKTEPAGMGGGAVGGFDVTIGDEGQPVYSPTYGSAEDNLEIDIKNKDNKLSALEDYIGKNPESAANLLRNWLNEE